MTAQFLRSQIPERHGRLRDGKLVVEAAHGLPPRTKIDRKTAEACGPTGGMDNGVQIDSMGGSAQEPVNWEDTEEHDALPSPERQVPPSAGNSSQVSKTPRTLRSAACKKPGADGKPNKRCKWLSDGSVGLAEAFSKFAFEKLCRGQGEKIVFKKLRRGQGEKIRWSS